jgi:hypothetical protein
VTLLCTRRLPMCCCPRCNGLVGHCVVDACGLCLPQLSCTQPTGVNLLPAATFSSNFSGAGWYVFGNASTSVVGGLATVVARSNTTGSPGVVIGLAQNTTISVAENCEFHLTVSEGDWGRGEGGVEVGHVFGSTRDIVVVLA